MRILLAASESAGLQVLRALHQEGRAVVGVLAPRETATGTSAIWTYAEKNGIPTFAADRVKDPAFAGEVADAEVDLFLNVHSLHVVHASVLEAVRVGAFNLHPGPLPRYAGLNAPSWAIFRGEERHGVTLHAMEAGIDTGPIAYQELFGIEEKDTGFSLYAKCIRQGVPLVLRLVKVASQDPANIPAVPQDLSMREYFGREVPGGGRLSWAQPARRIVDFVRACDYLPFPSPWGHPESRLHGRALEVIKAVTTQEASTQVPGTVVEDRGEGVAVASADCDVVVSRVRFDDRYRPAAEVLEPGTRLG